MDAGIYHASQVLGRLKVQERLRELRKGIAMDATEVLQRLAETARGSMDDFIERELDALIEFHLKRVLSPEKAAIVIAALRGQVH